MNLNSFVKICYLGIHGILFFFVGSALYSCTSLKTIGIEIAVQPEYTINADIQGIVLLNRSITNHFTNAKADSLEKILIKNKMGMDSVFQDSIASDTALQVAAQDLFKSGRFDVVVPKDRNIFRTDNEQIVNPLDNNFLNEICHDFKVDGVLVLESFVERLSTKYYLKLSDGIINDEEYSAATDITYFSDWRLYRPQNLKPVIRFQVGDSIFWKAVSFSLEDLYSQMPRSKNAIIGGGIAAGLKMANYISPKWVTQNRYYFLTGNIDIDAAIPLIKNNKWEEAATIWTKYANEKSKLIRSKVEFNLALTTEMCGDLVLAIEWGLKSFKTRYTKAAEVYLKTLDNRIKAQQKETKRRY